MAPFYLYGHSLTSCLLVFSVLTLTRSPILSLAHKALLQSTNFDSDVILFCDAEIANAGSSVQLTRPTASSSGLLVRSKPFKLAESEAAKPTSFSTDFSFSISPHSGDGLALVIVSTDFPSRFSRRTSFGLSRETKKFLGIEFDTSMDAIVGDQNANHIGVDVCSLVSARVSNVSSLNFVLNSGMKLRAWVDYDASSKRLEVRLNEFGSERPYDPLLVYVIDLWEMWKEEEVFVGISSSNGNSLQTSSIHSWKFKTRSVPKWMHSLPVDPQMYSDNGLHEQKAVHRRSPCPFTIISGLILATGCGALVTYMVMLLRAIFVNRNAVVSVDAVNWHPVDFKYKKVSVVVDDPSANIKN